MLSELQKKKLTRLFQFYDCNGNQVIDYKDIHEICQHFSREFGWATGSRQDMDFRAFFLNTWKNLINTADLNFDNKITLMEFITAHEKRISSELEYIKIFQPFLRHLFLIIDKEAKGKITAEEFGNLYVAFRNEKEQAMEVFKKMDLNHDGYLSFDELAIMHKQFYLSSNPQDPGNVFFGLYE
jgi:Ca2+-binding EF-hand superfamily protein